MIVKNPDSNPPPRPDRVRRCRVALLAVAAVAVAMSPRASAQAAEAPTSRVAPETRRAMTETAPAAPSLQETRVAMDKWIETQQLISKERKDWQQQRDILNSRLDIYRKEVAGLEEKIKVAESGVAAARKNRDELAAQNESLKVVGEQLLDGVAGMETEVRKLLKFMPEPIQTKLQPVRQRMPESRVSPRVTAAERFQGVIVIANEINKASTELTVAVEVHELAGGRPSEVQALYMGLAQAYYVSAGGEGGIGRPSENGWKWTPDKEVAASVVTALEILQGKHPPAFVGLPVKLQ